jgi:hypothetical protein
MDSPSKSVVKSWSQVLPEGWGLVEPGVAHRRSNAWGNWLHRVHTPRHDCVRFCGANTNRAGHREA